MGKNATARRRAATREKLRRRARMGEILGGWVAEEVYPEARASRELRREILDAKIESRGGRSAFVSTRKTLGQECREKLAKDLVRELGQVYDEEGVPLTDDERRAWDDELWGRP